MSRMGGYERDEYEEDLDEYEDDCGEQEYEDGDEYEYVEEQVHQPTQEELEYLAARQKLKEMYRKKLGTANGGSRSNTNASRNDNFGSFFGPSQPVIAQRVIQESKSLMENPNLVAKISKMNLSMNDKKRVSSNPAGSKPRVNPPKAINGLKKKVELIKDTRDYSFLLSEDAEIPVPTKTPQLNSSAPKSDARSAQLHPKSNHGANDRHPKSNQGANDRGRDISNNRDGRKPVINGQMRPKSGPSSSSKLPMESRKLLGSNHASGPGRPIGSQGGGGPSRSSVPATVKKVVNSGGKINPAGGGRKPMTSVQPQIRKPVTSHLQSSVNRPVQSGVHRGTSSHMQSSVSRNTSGRKEYQESNRHKEVPRSSLPSSRDVKRAPAKPLSRSAVSDQRPKPKPGKRPSEYDDEDEALSELRNMIRRGGYDPRKFRDDDDDRNMEAGFDDILREEKRSARIARQEDEEQARLLEEEEKRRIAKRRKMGH